MRKTETIRLLKSKNETIKENKMEKVGYGFYNPQQIDAETPKNIHIVVGSYDPLTKTFSRKRTCCCGKCTLKPQAGYKHVVAENTIEVTRMKAREIAKMFEDDGHTVCGQCVATLYSDDI